MMPPGAGANLGNWVRSEGVVSHISTVFSDRRGRLGSVLARQVWFIALILTFGSLGIWALDHLQPPAYESSAMVQVQTGTDTARVAAHILGRDTLLAIAARHGLTQTGPGARDKAALRLSQAIVLNALTADAGQSQGFPPQRIGLVVSVRLPDADLSARMANDVAQQILDDGNAGKLNATHDERDFYRRDELRLWQELSALRSEQDQAAKAPADLVARRQLALMQDQYDLVRQKLAGAEIATRLSDHLQPGQFTLLRRALATEAVHVGQDWLPVGALASLLLAVALAFVRDRQSASLDLTPLHTGETRFYRLFDDPARPIVGLPRYAVSTGLLVVGLYLLARWIG